MLKSEALRRGARGQRTAVDQCFVECRTEAAHRNLGGCAGRGRNTAHAGGAAADRDAGNTLNGGSKIGVGKRTDVFGGNRIHHTDRLFLDIQAFLDGCLDARDDDFRQVIGRSCSWSWRRGIRGVQRSAESHGTKSQARDGISQTIDGCAYIHCSFLDCILRSIPPCFSAHLYNSPCVSLLSSNSQPQAACATRAEKIIH